MLDYRIRRIPPLSRLRLRELGLQWFLDETDYFSDEMLALHASECDDLYDVGVTLYRMFEEAAQFVIQQQLWSTVGIPPEMFALIQYTFVDDRHLHLYSRFDLAGGIKNNAPKLLEYNADTPNALTETSIVQKEQLSNSAIQNVGQFNYLYRDLTKQFKRLRGLFPLLSPTLLITTTQHPEDKLNADLVELAAESAGFTIHYATMQQIVFSSSVHDGIVVETPSGRLEKFDFWFKLIPWHDLVKTYPALIPQLSSAVLQNQLVILNPPYTMLYESKALLKYVWDLNPLHELLLKTSFEKTDFNNSHFVKKPIFGEEGNNIRIFDNTGKRIAYNNGNSSNYPFIYQEFTPLQTDSYGESYQTSLFFTKETSALSFRRKKSLIVDEQAEFMGHFIMKE